MKKKPILYYIHDPMCSWCWGFNKTLKELTTQLNNIEFKKTLGGLAPDSEKPMPTDLRESIKNNWHRIRDTIPGTKFNFDFWKNCTPVRSTYPACRASIAARLQGDEDKMILAIQEAYYLQARNPSKYETLYDIAKNLKLDLKQFKHDVHSQHVEDILQDEISFSRKIGADSFPSLYLYANNKYQPIVLDYNHADIILEHINSFL